MMPGSIGSRASASEGSVSEPTSKASSCSTVSGSGTAPPASANTRNGATSGVAWAKMYWMNLRTLSYTWRPASIATTIVAKLSSVSTIVDASRATSVPERPIATPMSATRRAGASLTPSPVIATT